MWEVWERARTEGMVIRGWWGPGERELVFICAEAQTYLIYLSYWISPDVKLCKCNTFENETLHLSWTLETPDCGVEWEPWNLLAGSPQQAGKWEAAAYSSLQADFAFVLLKLNTRECVHITGTSEKRNHYLKMNECQQQELPEMLPRLQSSFFPK